MTDHPLTLSQHEARAFRAGTQTQFLRVLKPQPEAMYVAGHGIGRAGHPGEWTHIGSTPTEDDWTRWAAKVALPFAVGDRLWCRETWRCNGWASDVATIFYRASQGDGYTVMCEQYPVVGKKRVSVSGSWRPSTQMPRWASRTTLTVREVRIQRLQEISCTDAIAEGIRAAANSQTIDCDTPDPRVEFRERWNRLHGAGAWDANPWVIACTVEVTLGNIDGGGNG